MLCEASWASEWAFFWWVAQLFIHGGLCKPDPPATLIVTPTMLVVASPISLVVYTIVSLIVVIMPILLIVRTPIAMIVLLSPLLLVWALEVVSLPLKIIDILHFLLLLIIRIILNKTSITLHIVLHSGFHLWTVSPLLVHHNIHSLHSMNFLRFS